MGGMRKIAAILVADVVGYSRLAGADEDRTLSRLRGLRSDLIDPAIDAHHGRIVKRTGDGNLIEFRSVVDAVRCAIEVQNGMVERNAGVAKDREIRIPRRYPFRRRGRRGRRRPDGRRHQYRSPSRRYLRAGRNLPVPRGLRASARQGKGVIRRSGREGAQKHRAAGSRLRPDIQSLRRSLTETFESRPRSRCQTSPRSPSCLSRT